MLRLTLTLCAAIYAVLVIYSEPDTAAEADAPHPVEVTQGTQYATPLLTALTTENERLQTSDGRALRIATVIEPWGEGHSLNQLAAFSTMTTADVLAQSAVAEAVAPLEQALPMLQVTGSQVNLRAGPSTDDAILDALVRGEQAELIASLDNGWVQIRVSATGIEGYMSDQFLTPVY